MNLSCTRLILRSSSSLIKTHCCKLYSTLPGTSPRFSVSSHSRCFYGQKKVPQDSEDDFELFEAAIESNYKDVNIEEITGGDPKKAKILKICQMEVSVSVQKGGRIPKTMTTEHWCKLIQIPSHSQRVRYVRWLWSCEVRRDNSKFTKMENHEKYLETMTIRNRNEIPTNAPVKYGLCDASLVHRIRDIQINKFYNYKLLQAMMYGPHILVDCQYEAFMSPREMSLCTQQLQSMWLENRHNRNPFDVIFCNFEEANPIFQKLRKALMGLDTDPTFPLNVTGKHYLDLFPREKLVYLTPHCDTNLKKFSGNDIYIIGAMVEVSRCEPISLAKAKKDRIRYAKFPLDLYMNWKQGKKSLTLNQCLAIMNDVKDGKDWPYAFRHIPENEVKDYIDKINRRTEEIRDTRHNAKSTEKTTNETK